MKQIIRKMYLSILTSILVLVVSVTTTYAWAGILSYSSTEKFSVNLEKQEQSDYAILISTDGVHFSDSLNGYDLKRAILTNMGIDCSSYEDSFVADLFSKVELNPVSMQKRNNEVGPFVCLDEVTSLGFNYGNVTEESEFVKKSYFDFDLYVTFNYAGRTENITEEVLTENQIVYLDNVPNMIRSQSTHAYLANPYSFKDYFFDKTFTDVSVNAANAARVAISKYEVMTRGIPDDSKAITDTYIYQGGTALPTVDEGIYSFGGMMDSDNNIALTEYNTIYPKKSVSLALLDEFRNNRSNASGTEDAIAINEATEGNWLVDPDEGLNTKTMVKFNIKFWIEGFDGDCFLGISGLPVSLNLTLATKKHMDA